MSLTIPNVSVDENEQIKNTESSNDSILKLVFKSLKTILEKDEFDFFKTQRKYNLDKRIKASNQTIEKLIQLNVSGKTQGKNLKARYNKIGNENFNLIQELTTKLGISK